MAPQIKLNGETIQVDPAGAETLSGLLKLISEERFGPDEVITDIVVNGERLEPEEAADFAVDAPLGQISSLSLTTASSPQAKGAQLLAEMGEYLKRLTGGMSLLADTFRVGKPEEANTLLVDALSGLSAFVELLQTAKMLSRTDLSSLTLDGESMTSMEEKLLGVLTDFKEGQEAGDWVTVADLLEYELAPQLDWWKGFIPKMETELLKDAL
ncbi:MAG: hypothetical protein ACNS63_09135 [Candidatus Nitrospinota bacterium M3_3B_026]